MLQPCVTTAPGATGIAAAAPFPKGVRLMRRALVFAVMFPVACSGPSQPPWSSVKGKLIGKTYEEVVACAGVPEGVTTVGQETGAILYRENDMNPSSTCEATMLVKEGQVVSITQRQNDQAPTFAKVAWPNYTLCSKRFQECPWTR